jgi:hypothetical protein
MMKRIVWTAATLCGLLVGALAFAAPTGEQVMMGDVTFNQDGSVTVIHASDGAIIHYDSFDIFAGEILEFVQPSDQARVLNRVFGDATHIDFLPRSSATLSGYTIEELYNSWPSYELKATPQAS